VRASAAQPRQVRKEATVSGFLLRRGPPAAEHFFCLKCMLKSYLQRHGEKVL